MLFFKCNVPGIITGSVTNRYNKITDNYMAVGRQYTCKQLLTS